MTTFRKVGADVVLKLGILKDKAEAVEGMHSWPGLWQRPAPLPSSGQKLSHGAVSKRLRVRGEWVGVRGAGGGSRDNNNVWWQFNARQDNSNQKVHNLTRTL
jgi:hypothetical protein